MDSAQYVAGLKLEGGDAVRRRGLSRFRGSGGGETQTGPLDAAVDAGAVIAFQLAVTPQQRSDVLSTLQLAQRAASGSFNRFSQTEQWYGKFVEVMEHVGWVPRTFGFVKHEQGSGKLEMDSHAINLLEALASASALGVLKQAIGALKGAAEKDRAITLFEKHATQEKSGNFQVSTVERKAGGLSMAMGAFYFQASDSRRRTVFASWGSNEVEFWSAAQEMELLEEQFAKIRDLVKARLGDPTAYVAELILAD